MRFNGGIGYEIDQLKDLGVPELMRKQSIDPQLKYALALQEATKLVEAAVRERDMAQQMPVPADVIGQMETGLAQKLTPGVQQRGQRSMQGAPPQMAPPQMAQGISGMPAPNMGAIGSAQGGIIGYQQGGSIAPSVLAETTAYMKAKAVLADPQATPQAKAFAQNTLDTLRPINAGGSVDPQTYAQMLQQVDSLTAFSTQPQQNTGMKEGGFLYPSQLASEKFLEFIRPAVKNNTDIDKILDSLKMAESSGNPLARGEAGELGAYQIRPSTAADPGFGVAPFTGDLFDPVASRKFAQEYLQAMLDRYNGNMEAALVAYNAGASNADKFVAAGNDYTALPRPEQTKTYVQRVMNIPSEENISPRMQRAFEANRRREAGETETGFSDDLRDFLAPPPAEGDRDPMAQRALAERNRLQDRLDRQSNRQDAYTSEEKAAGGLGYLQYLARRQQEQQSNNADRMRAAFPGLEERIAETNRSRAYTSEEKAAGGLGYLQYLARRQQEQQSNNADRMREAFPDLEENIAETNRSRAYTSEEKAAGGLGYLQYLARKQREQQKQQSNIVGYLAQSQRAANTIAQNDPAANHGVDIKLPYGETPAQRAEDAAETARRENPRYVRALEASRRREAGETETGLTPALIDFLAPPLEESVNGVVDPRDARALAERNRLQARLDRQSKRQEEDAMASGGIVGYAGLEGSTVEAEPEQQSNNADRMREAFPGLEERIAETNRSRAYTSEETADEDTSDIEEDGMFASVINLAKENPAEAASIALLLAPAIIASARVVPLAGMGLIGRAAIPLVAKYGPRAFSAIRNGLKKTYTTPIPQRPLNRGPPGKSLIPYSPIAQRSFSLGRMLQTVGAMTGLSSLLTRDGEEEAPELSNADRMREAFPGLEEHLANLKNQKASGISTVKPQQNNLFRALDVLSRGGGASKGYEFATINEETRRIKEAEQARQDNLYELEQRSDIARAQIGATQAGQSVDIQTAIMQALEEYESSPAYVTALEARKDAGETEEGARTSLLNRKYQDLAAMFSSGGIGSMPGLEEDGVVARQYLEQTR